MTTIRRSTTLLVICLAAIAVAVVSFSATSAASFRHAKSAAALQSTNVLAYPYKFPGPGR